MTKKSKHISHLIRIGIAATAMVYFIVKNNPRGIINDFSRLDTLIFLLIAVLLYAAGNLVFVLRWLILLRAQGVSVDYWPALKLHLLGLFYNNCLPGSVGGDLLRAWYVTKHTDKKIEAAMSVFVDRAIGLICTIAMVFLAYWLIPADGSETQLKFGAEFNIVSLLVKFLLAVLILVILAVIVLAVMYYSRKLRPTLLKYVFIFGLKWKLWFDRIITAVKLYCCRPFILLLAIFLSFICQALPIFGLCLVGKSLAIEAPVKYYYVFFPLSWIIGIIPISVGGAGVMELGIQKMFEIIGVFDPHIAALALAQRFTWFTVSIPGVIIHLTGKHLPDEEEIEKEIIS